MMKSESLRPKCIRWWMLFIVGSALTVVSVQGQECGVVGTNAGELDDNRDQNFYLNTQDPAPCNGTINQFDFCYYRATAFADSYSFTFAVFRETSSGSYSVVSEAFSPDINRDVSAPSFSCSNLPVMSQVQIQAGDVIGACVYDPPGSDRRQRDVVSGDAGDDRYLMRTGTSGCGDSTVPSPVSSLTRVDSRVLHISANITPLPTTEPPTTMVETSSTETTMETSSTTVTQPTDPVTSSTVVETSTMDTTVTMMSTASPTDPPADNRSMTTMSPGQPLTPTDNSGTIAAVLVILLLLIVVVVTATITAVIVIKKRRTSKSLLVGGANDDPASFQKGIDNAIYSANGLSPDYQEVGSAKHSSPTSALTKSDNHYEFEHTYEFTGTNSSAEASYYAEVGPLQDVARPSPLDRPGISYRELLELNKEEDIYGSVNAYEVPASRENEIYAQLKTWGVPHIHRDEVEIGGHLGSGQFGSVEQGVWKREGTRPVDVALKSLNKTSEEDKVKFLQEAAIMAQFRHPNVIVLHGMIVKSNPTMIVVELAKRGDLRNFLLSSKPDPGEIMPGGTPQMLLKFSQQVALGMQYLSAKGFVHRDLAARNVLVTSDNVCKVADFGMSRDLADENYYVSQGKDKIPVKWTAPEAIHYKKYSTASDVWAYGCLLYEIWSVGHKPFENYRIPEVLQLIDSGTRLPPPPGTPRTVYELMVICWNPETSKRPTFRDIVLTLVGSEKMVLNVPKKDSSTNPLAGVLGAPLEAGENMYSELQRKYK